MATAEQQLESIYALIDRINAATAELHDAVDTTLATLKGDASDGPH